MASTLPVQAFVKSNASLVRLLAPPPFLLLFLLLFLSLLSLLYIHELLTHSLSRPPLFYFLPTLHFDKLLLLFDKQGLFSHLPHLLQHYLAFLLSPCPIFILANLIVFTLFLSVYFSSSASSSGDFVPEETFHYGEESALAEHALPSHDDFFLAPPPPRQHFVLLQDEYHVLSFNTNYVDESTYCSNVLSYNKLSDNWEKVKQGTINPYTSSHVINGDIAQEEVKKPEKSMMMEKVHSMPTVVVATPAYKVLNVDQGKVVEKSLPENRLQEKGSRSTKATAYSSPGSQAVIINMELAPASKARTRILTNSNMQASHPPLAPPAAPLRQPTKMAPSPSNTSNSSIQRPPSSPRVKKSLQSTKSCASSEGRCAASKPIHDDEKQAPKPRTSLKKPSSMVRSHSDQQLSQRDPSTEVTTVLTSPSSLTNRPRMQRAQSLRSSSPSNTAASVLTSSSSPTNKPPTMLRAQSLRGNRSTSYKPNSPSHGQVTRSTSFSASLHDGLSDAEANKCFSDFIAHRFELMKRERD